MKLRSYLRSSISIIVTGVFLYLAFRSVDLNALWQTLLQADIFWVLMLIPIGFFGNWFRAVRWRYLLAPVKRGDLRLRNLFSAVMIGYAVNNVLPRVGEIVRPVVVGKLEGVSKSAALATVIVERVLDILTFSFMVSMTLLVSPSAIDPFVEDPSSMQPLFIAGSIAATGVFVLLLFRLEWIVSTIERIRAKLPGRMSARVESVLQSFRSGLAVAHLRDSWQWVVVWSVLMWAMYALGLYAAFFMFDEIASLGLGPGAAVILLVVSTIAFTLPAPGAMGTYHSFLPAAMTTLYGVGQTTALGMAIVTHELQYIMVMIFGAYFYVADHSRIGSLREKALSTEGSSV